MIESVILFYTGGKGPAGGIYIIIINVEKGELLKETVCAYRYITFLFASTAANMAWLRGKIICNMHLSVEMRNLCIRRCGWGCQNFVHTPVNHWLKKWDAGCKMCELI